MCNNARFPPLNMTYEAIRALSQDIEAFKQRKKLQGKYLFLLSSYLYVSKNLYFIQKYTSFPYLFQDNVLIPKEFLLICSSLIGIFSSIISSSPSKFSRIQNAWYCAVGLLIKESCFRIFQ